MDWASIVTNVGFPIATALGLAWFTMSRLDKTDKQWEQRAQEWKDEKKQLIDQLLVYRDKMENKLTTMDNNSRETIGRSTAVMQEAVALIKAIKKTI